MEAHVKVEVHAFVLDEVSTPVSWLEVGRAMVIASRSDVNWMTPPSRIDESAFTMQQQRLYQYNAKPPQIQIGNRWRGLESLQEWGVLDVRGSEECISMQDLDEFESTDFQVVVCHPRRPHSCGPFHVTGGSTEVFPYQHRIKRESEELHDNRPVKRFKLDMSSILRLIPQPHFLPVPFINFPELDTSKFPHFAKAHPLPVPPYSAASISELLESKHRRGAWLIPIRGQLPSEGASTAIIVKSPWDTGLASGNPHPATHKISWTREMLIDFWNFLIKLQQATQLGPISLSFHAAPSGVVPATDTASSPTEESTNNPYHQLHHYDSKSKTTIGSSLASDNLAPHVYRARLEAADYIKMYHDLPYALSLRSILDAYQYRPDNPGAKDPLIMGDARKFRVLKDARLAFMDERSKVAFLM